MNSKCVIPSAVGALLILLVAGLVWRLRPEREAPQRSARQALERLERALASSDAKALLEAVCVPAAVRERTEAEQSEFLRKALADEVSADGIRALAREGVFGPLASVFSNDAARWAGQAGVSVSECVAFRLEKNGVVAEVAIATNGTPRVIRCNNVKQMALSRR